MRRVVCELLVVLLLGALAPNWAWRADPALAKSVHDDAAAGPHAASEVAQQLAEPASLGLLAAGTPLAFDDASIQKLLPTDGAAGDYFGYSVAVWDDTAVVGSHYDDDQGSGSGSARVFVRVDGIWTQQAKLAPTDGAADDFFGFYTAVCGDTILIGAPGDDDNGVDSGSAYVFTRTGTVWTQQAKLLASDGAEGDGFGRSVAVYGDRAVVGAHGDDDMGVGSGSAYVYLRTGATWAPQVKLVASDGGALDRFGYTVAVTSDYAVIGAHGEDGEGDGAGAAYVFACEGTVWTEQAKLIATDGAAGDEFGFPVAASGESVMIGARNDDDMGSASGSAYVFTRTGTAWTQQAKLTASDGAADDRFGFEVAIYDDTAVVGAFNDDDGGSDSGSAYVFTRSGATWGSGTKLTAPDGAADDWFGFDAAISAGGILVSAPQDDDLQSESGSVYVHTSLPPLPDAVEDTPFLIPAPGPLANDSDPEGSPLTAVLASQPANGSVSLQADGSFTYTPHPDFCGMDSFTYRASDGALSSDLATVAIRVLPADDAPVLAAIGDRSAVVSSELAFTASAHDVDIPAQTLTFTLGAGAPEGAQISEAGAFSWTPSEAQGPGLYPITVYVSDGALFDSETFTVAVSNTVAIEDDAKGVYFGRLIRGVGAAYSGGSYVYGYSKTPYTGTRFETSFTGDKVRWIGPKQPNYGQAKVYLDGAYVTTVDCYAAPGDAAISTTVWQSADLTDGPHTLAIEMGSAKNAASTNYIVVIDKIEVDGAEPLGPVGVRENETTGTFIGGWVKNLPNTTYTYGTYAYSYWAGARFVRNFTGTRVAWIGPKIFNYGRAAVYIDGVYKGTVSQYAPGASIWFRAKVWESAVLPAGNHTFEIRVLGTKDAASTGTFIVVDSIDVTP